MLISINVIWDLPPSILLNKVKCSHNKKKSMDVGSSNKEFEFI